MSKLINKINAQQYRRPPDLLQFINLRSDHLELNYIYVPEKMMSRLL
jgi:hypothetical protein